MKKQTKCLALGIAAFTLALFIGDFCRGQSQNEIAYYNTPAVMPSTAREKNQEFEEGIELCDNTQVVFASVEEAQKILTARDPYINSLTPFDRKVRMNSQEPVSEKNHLDFVGEQALPWSQYEKIRAEAAIKNLATRLKDYDLNLPPGIPLVKTTGKEEGGAAYCRGDAIVLPQNILNRPGAGLEGLITHELFHIFTKNNPKTREALYRIINFKRCEGKTELPGKLLEMEVTNPDVPVERYYVEVAHQGENIKVIPLITVPNFDASKNGPFFGYLKLELVEVERVENGYSYVRKEGDEPLVFTARELPDYFKKIGENTGYVIHPEEILADNFTIMVMGRQPVKSKWVIDKMRDLLANKSPRSVGVN
jgi:hypothetical protein